LTAPNLLTILSGHGALARNPRRNLSCSLPQTSLSRASSSSLGAIVYADRAHLGAGAALAVRNTAHGNTDRHRSIVVVSSA